MTPTEFLSQLTVEVKPSPIHGVGVFAIRDIKKGENVWHLWQNDDLLFIVPKVMFEELPPASQKVLLRHCPPDVTVSSWWRHRPNTIFVKLKKSMYLMYEPFIFANASEEYNTTVSGLAVRDIAEGEEILTEYSLENNFA